MRSVIGYSFRMIFTVAASLPIGLIAQTSAGYGDLSGGLPLWKERQILVLANACRMSPVQYRDAYVGNYAILMKYPAVSPLYFNTSLGMSAHAHALDMGDTCGIMQHPSCNGTSWSTRIKSYYTANSTIGENIALGNADPFMTMNQWIMDNPQGSNQPAADSSLCTTSTAISLCDGHRCNIMNKAYKEMGAGYTYGVNSAARIHHFWVQDFGGGAPSVANPIIGGSHFLKENGKTTFLANYWDPGQKTPAEASMFLTGQKNTMTILMGSAFRGTYQLAVSRGTDCRTYYFFFTDGSGKTWRYPEQGSLMTSGEGACTSEYESRTMAPLLPDNRVVTGNAMDIISRASSSEVILFVRNGLFFPQSTELIDCKGRMIACRRWRRPGRVPGAGEGVFLHMAVQPRLREGIYFIVNRISDAHGVCEKILFVR
jgi:hypothetical protein